MIQVRHNRRLDGPGQCYVIGGFSGQGPPPAASGSSGNFTKNAKMSGLSLNSSLNPEEGGAQPL